MQSNRKKKRLKKENFQISLQTRSILTFLFHGGFSRFTAATPILFPASILITARLNLTPRAPSVTPRSKFVNKNSNLPSQLKSADFWLLEPVELLSLSLAASHLKNIELALIHKRKSARTSAPILKNFCCNAAIKCCKKHFCLRTSHKSGFAFVWRQIQRELLRF